jgi:hypothetical protein
MNYIVFALIIFCFAIVAKLLYDKNKVVMEKEIIQFKYDDLNKQYMFFFDQIYDSIYEEFSDHYIVKFRVKEPLRHLIVAKDSEIKVNYEMLDY